VAFDLLLAICSAITFGLMIIKLLLLPEPDGRSLAHLETAAAGDRSLSHAYSELTISATTHPAVSFLNVFRRRCESGGDQQDERKFCPP
jgi:hypothetical protein